MHANFHPSGAEPQRSGALDGVKAQVVALDLSNSIEAQRVRMLDHLRTHGRLTTIEAREDLDVLHPAQRVLELRERGHPILTYWSREATQCGRLHRVARYVLTGDGQ